MNLIQNTQTVYTGQKGLTGKKQNPNQPAIEFHYTVQAGKGGAKNKEWRTLRTNRPKACTCETPKGVPRKIRSKSTGADAEKRIE